MKGKQIYFTQEEIQALLKALDGWENLLNDEEIYANSLKYGLGTAWYKLTEAAHKNKIG